VVLLSFFLHLKMLSKLQSTHRKFKQANKWRSFSFCHINYEEKELFKIEMLLLA